MNFEMLKNNKLLVTLSHKDMKNFKITNEEFNCKSLDARRVIWEILFKAKDFLNKSPNFKASLEVTVSCHNDGGCNLLFTHLNKREDDILVIKKGTETTLFCAFNINAFIDALKFLKSSLSLYEKAEAFKYKNNCYIALTPTEGNLRKLCFSLSEFGKTEGFTQREIAEIYEFGRPLNCLS